MVDYRRQQLKGSMNSYLQKTSRNKMSANPTKGTEKYPECSLGVAGFEPATT